jgi:DnaJ-class molecular chaperone
MKTLSASKIAAIAACASTSVAAENGPNFSDNGKLLRRASLKAVISAMRVPRGGDTDGNETPDPSKPPKEFPRQKKKRQRHRDRSSDDAKAKTSDNSIPKEKNTPSKIVEEILQHDDFYQVLGVSRDAPDVQIKKAYRKRAVQTHPDKTGGDRRAFDKVAEAYDALSDESKRALYDRSGKAGLDSGAGMQSSSSYHDVFRSMFQQQAQSRRRQNHTVRYQLQVTLEDLYKGMTQSILVTPPNGREKKKKVQVHVPKGCVSGQSIVLSGEMDFATNDTPGDLIFILTQVPHPVFTRKSHDLVMESTISLEEAVCGLQRSIRHIDGCDICIQSARDGETPVVIQTGDVQVLKGRGMPKKNHNDEFGDLYIQFRVEMPKAKSGNPLSNEELAELSRLLSKLQGTSSRKEMENNSEVSSLRPASASEFGRASGSIRLDEDDHSQDDQGDEIHPFASSFFQQGASRGSSFYFGGNSFGGPDPYGGDDGSNVQCQQM